MMYAFGSVIIDYLILKVNIIILKIEWFLSGD
jgi:hypothetical protein